MRGDNSPFTLDEMLSKSVEWLNKQQNTSDNDLFANVLDMKTKNTYKIFSDSSKKKYKLSQSIYSELDFDKIAIKSEVDEKIKQASSSMGKSGSAVGSTFQRYGIDPLLGRWGENILGWVEWVPCALPIKVQDMGKIEIEGYQRRKLGIINTRLKGYNNYKRALKEHNQEELDGLCMAYKDHVYLSYITDVEREYMRDKKWRTLRSDNYEKNESAWSFHPDHRGNYAYNRGSEKRTHFYFLENDDMAYVIVKEARHNGCRGTLAPVPIEDVMRMINICKRELEETVIFPDGAMRFPDDYNFGLTPGIVQDL